MEKLPSHSLVKELYGEDSYHIHILLCDFKIFEGGIEIISDDPFQGGSRTSKTDPYTKKSLKGNMASAPYFSEK